MGIFAKALKAEFANTTFRDNPVWGNYYNQTTLTGDNITVDKALGMLAIYASVRLIAEDVAKLPMITYKTTPDGRERAEEDPIYGLLHDAPNPEMTAMSFKESMTGQMLLRGNAFAEIERANSGQILNLWPLRADRISLWRYPSSAKLVYIYALPNGEYAIIQREDIFHLRGFGALGTWGYSPIEMAREELAGMKASRDWATLFYANDATPGGVLIHPGELSDTARTNIEKSWDESHRGLNNTHRIAILEEGVEWRQVGMKPEDAAWVETQRWGTEQAARLYRLAPTKLSDYSRATFSNIEETNIDHVVSTLDSHLVRWDQQATKDFFGTGNVGPSRMFVEHLRDALFRGRLLDRYRAYAIAINWGWMSPNEVREKENLNRIPGEGGDSYVIPVNMQTQEQLLEPPQPPPQQLNPAQSPDQQNNQNNNFSNGSKPQKAAAMLAELAFGDLGEPE